jgi:hypothetical protein
MRTQNRENHRQIESFRPGDTETLPYTRQVREKEWQTFLAYELERIRRVFTSVLGPL